MIPVENERLEPENDLSKTSKSPTFLGLGDVNAHYIANSNNVFLRGKSFKITAINHKSCIKFDSQKKLVPLNDPCPKKTAMSLAMIPVIASGAVMLPGTSSIICFLGLYYKLSL